MAQEGGAQQNYVPPFGGIPAPPSYYGDVPMQAWGSGASMLPPNFAVPNIALGSHMHILLNHNKVWPSLEDTLRETCKISQPSKPMQTRWVKEMQTSFELGCIHLAPPAQFIGGAVQSYYEQGYNNQDYQYQPPAED
jgi:hypothetical protein